MEINHSGCDVSLRLTLWVFILIPTRKMNSAMKRLQHRFLWMVVLVLWISLRNQKVKMHMDRQMREMIIPSWVILVRMVWWATSWEARWEGEGEKSHFLTQLK